MGRQLTPLLTLVAASVIGASQAAAGEVAISGNLTTCPSLDEVAARVSSMTPGSRVRVGRPGRSARNVQLMRGAAGVRVTIDGHLVKTLPRSGDHLCERRLAGLANLIATALMPAILDVAEPAERRLGASSDSGRDDRFKGAVAEAGALADVQDLETLVSAGAEPVTTRPEALEGPVGPAKVAAPRVASRPLFASPTGASVYALQRTTQHAYSVDIFGSVLLVLDCGSCQHGWSSAADIGAGVRGFYWPTDRVAIGLGLRGTAGTTLSAPAGDFLLRRFPLDLTFRWLPLVGRWLHLALDLGAEVAFSEVAQGTTHDARVEAGTRTGLQLGVRSWVLVGVDLQVLFGNRIDYESVDRAPSLAASLSVGVPLAL